MGNQIVGRNILTFEKVDVITGIIVFEVNEEFTSYGNELRNSIMNEFSDCILVSEMLTHDNILYKILINIGDGYYSLFNINRSDKNTLNILHDNFNSVKNIMKSYPSVNHKICIIRQNEQYENDISKREIIEILCSD